jgi:hypothetical protein
LVRVRKWLPEVKTTRQTVTFQPADDSFVDLLVLREALATGHAGRLDEVLRLYEGDFLANFHADYGRFGLFAAGR